MFDLIYFVYDIYTIYNIFNLRRYLQISHTVLFPSYCIYRILKNMGYMILSNSFYLYNYFTLFLNRIL